MKLLHTNRIAPKRTTARVFPLLHTNRIAPKRTTARVFPLLHTNRIVPKRTTARVFPLLHTNRIAPKRTTARVFPFRKLKITYLNHSCSNSSKTSHNTRSGNFLMLTKVRQN